MNTQPNIVIDGRGLPRLRLPDGCLVFLYRDREGRVTQIERGETCMPEAPSRNACVRRPFTDADEAYIAEVEPHVIGQTIPWK